MMVIKKFCYIKSIPLGICIFAPIIGKATKKIQNTIHKYFDKFVQCIHKLKLRQRFQTDALINL